MNTNRYVSRRDRPVVRALLTRLAVACQLPLLSLRHARTAAAKSDLPKRLKMYLNTLPNGPDVISSRRITGCAAGGGEPCGNHSGLRNEEPVAPVFALSSST